MRETLDFGTDLKQQHCFKNYINNENSLKNQDLVAIIFTFEYSYGNPTDMFLMPSKLFFVISLYNFYR